MWAKRLTSLKGKSLSSWASSKAKITFELLCSAQLFNSFRREGKAVFPLLSHDILTEYPETEIPSILFNASTNFAVLFLFLLIKALILLPTSIAKLLMFMYPSKLIISLVSIIMLGDSHSLRKVLRTLDLPILLGPKRRIILEFFTPSFNSSSSLEIV